MLVWSIDVMPLKVMHSTYMHASMCKLDVGKQQHTQQHASQVHKSKEQSSLPKWYIVDGECTTAAKKAYAATGKLPQD